jgi:hypothetical protein
MLLTKIPIVIYYGDNIPEKPSANPGQEQWRIFLEMARKWRDVVNRRGGDVTLVHLPEIGIRGNTHFPMSDTNNVQIADQVWKFLSEKKLDWSAAKPRGAPSHARTPAFPRKTKEFEMVDEGHPFLHIRRGRVALHREWMIRAFAIGLAVAAIRPIVGVFFATRVLTHLTGRGWHHYVEC